MERANLRLHSPRRAVASWMSRSQIQVAGTDSHLGKKLPRNFCVHRTEAEALAEGFAPDARLGLGLGLGLGLWLG